jgi:hypothetical protein
MIFVLSVCCFFLLFACDAYWACLGTCELRVASCEFQLQASASLKLALDGTYGTVQRTLTTSKRKPTSDKHEKRKQKRAVFNKNAKKYCSS